MSRHDATRIYKPPFFRISRLKQGRGNRRPFIIGFDSEAHSCDISEHPECDENGYPFLYQFAYPDGTFDLIDVPRTGRRYETFFVFVRHLWDICKRKDQEYIVVGYNLQYEYTQLFRDIAPALKDAGEFRLGVKPTEPCILPIDNIPFYVTAMNEKRYSFTIEWAHTKRRVRVIDAMAFLPGGLDNAARMIGAGRKAERPATFERGSARTAEMVEYASQDAILTQRLGEFIIDLHERYDVTLAISAPHFASKVYKRAFLRDGIKLPDADLEQYGLRSYHGGKNGFYLPHPQELPGVWHVDIRSAYPEAMRNLPDPESSEWLFHDRYIPDVAALWHVRGNYTCCLYRALMDDTSWPVSGTYDAICTGYELDSAIRHGEFVIESCEGFVMTGPTGTGSLVEYVDTFYRQKSEAKSQTEKVAAKLFLNSLYGKFFQKVPQGNVGSVDLDSGKIIETDPEQAYDHIAGGLYHPPIASLITGFVRAKIHDLEHLCGSVMTSTDGFFSRKPPPEHMLGKALGMLAAEQGDLRILRERAYIFDPYVPEHGPDCAEDCQERHPVAAVHGFWQTVDELRAVPLTPGMVYRYLSKPKPVGLRESNRAFGGKRYAPGVFIRQERDFRLPGTPRPIAQKSLDTRSAVR